MPIWYCQHIVFCHLMIQSINNFPVSLDVAAGGAPLYMYNSPLITLNTSHTSVAATLRCRIPPPPHKATSQLTTTSRESSASPAHQIPGARAPAPRRSPRRQPPAPRARYLKMKKVSTRSTGSRGASLRCTLMGALSLRDAGGFGMSFSASASMFHWKGRVPSRAAAVRSCVAPFAGRARRARAASRRRARGSSP